MNTTDEAITAFNIAKDHYSPVIDNLNGVTWEQLSDEVKGFLRANTWMDPAQVVLVLLWLGALPATEVDLAIETLGFTPKGAEDDGDDGWGPTLDDAFAFAT